MTQGTDGDDARASKGSNARNELLLHNGEEGAMPTTTDPSRRSWLMQLLRISPGPLMLFCLGGGALMAVAAIDRNPMLRDAGISMLVLGGALFIVILWGGVYLQVVEASRAMPGLRPVEKPTLEDEPAAGLEALERALSGLGFRHHEWFSLDDFDETHIGAWKHDECSAAAFVMYFPAGRLFRLRFASKFPDGGILVSSTRMVDLAIAPPQGIYLQVRSRASVEELWAWHLEAESLFPTAQPAGDARPREPRDLYIEVSSRWAGHRRRDRTWLLAVEPVEEFWRIYWLRGMALREQFERGWTTPYWR